VRVAGVGVAVAGVVLGVVGYRLLRDDLDQTVVRSIPAVAIGWTAIAAGLIAWSRRPANRMGLLLVAYGFSVLLRTWQYSPDSLMFTIGYALGELNLALFAHATFAYPSGRLTDRVERTFVYVVYAVVLAIPLATLLVYDGNAGLRYVRPSGTESLLLISPGDEVARRLEQGFVIVVYGVLVTIGVALVVRKLWRATPRTRRVLAPLLLAALVAASRAVSEPLFAFLSPPPAIVDYLYWWQVVGQIAIPIAFLAGLLFSRLAAAQVADLVRDLDRVPPEQLAPALARALDDPTLQLAFWLPDRQSYADADGKPFVIPEDDSRCAVTRIESDGKQIAALVHDRSLLEDPELVQAAAGAARLAIENARLHAEVRAQLEEVRQSRARIVAAGDQQRRSIERDIHDGAQQRLVALALELRAAQRRHGDALSPAVDSLLADTVDQLQLAVTELRELARGVHPAILTEGGLGPALQSLAARTPLSVSVAAPEDRFAADLEAAAYFVACEALANAVKHAGASAVSISAVRQDGLLVVEVSDDGVGGAGAVDGGGLRGLADRVEAHGGRLRVVSPPGQGTRVIGELPCAP
jgi:signal transduction histidine kinase